MKLLVFSAKIIKREDVGKSDINLEHRQTFDHLVKEIMVVHLHPRLQQSWSVLGPLLQLKGEQFLIERS